MSARVAKALALATGHVRRRLGRKPMPAKPAIRSPADVTRFEVPSVAPALIRARRHQLLAWYWQHHPRFAFFKRLPPGASALDLGVGTGGLPFWRGYLEPKRRDIRLYGVDLHEPVTRVLYEAFEVADLDERFPFPEGAFDAVFASHILEHVAEPSRVMAGIAARLAPGGRAYVEMPAPASKSLPSAQAYRERGWPMVISNFHDDATHRETLALPDLVAMAAREGLDCVESGTISMPLLEDTLIARGLSWRDPDLLLYGYWSKTRWAQYAVLER